MKATIKPLALTLLAPLAATFLLVGSAAANPVVTQFEGNPTCAVLMPDATDLIAYRIEDPTSDHFTDSLLNVSIDHYDDGTGSWFLDWAKNAPANCSIHGVKVKGGNGGFFYSYDPALGADTGLHGLANPSGKYAEVSHVDFCYSCTVVYEGCSHGYWKNHLDSWAATGYLPADLLAGAFSTAYVQTLIEGLNFGGGTGVDGATRNLFKQAVASLLNAAHPDVDFPLTVGQVVAGVNAALATGNRGVINGAADDLDINNNLGCPLN
jgi:hypothetical protein